MEEAAGPIFVKVEGGMLIPDEAGPTFVKVEGGTLIPGEDELVHMKEEEEEEEEEMLATDNDHMLDMNQEEGEQMHYAGPTFVKVEEGTLIPDEGHMLDMNQEEGPQFFYAEPTFVKVEGGTYIPDDGVCSMAPKKSRDQQLKEKREKEKLRMEKIRNDPVLWKIQQEKQHLKNKKKLEKKQVKLVKDMTNSEHRLQKKEWRERWKKSYNNRKTLKLSNNLSNLTVANSSPQTNVLDTS
ncbi:uncharacterized protein [Halyomorpha halys]|uniref:uncharacterized protein isoform X5 n=1 Tax=Halyomorpha halys TaxID=286706 RepID=UPI0034D24716